MLEEAINNLNEYVKVNLEDLINKKIDIVNNKYINIECTIKYGMSASEIDNNILKIKRLYETFNKKGYIEKISSIIEIIYKSELKAAYKITLICNALNRNIMFFDNPANFTEFKNLYTYYYPDNLEMRKEFDENVYNYKRIREIISFNNHLNPLKEANDSVRDLFKFLNLDEEIIGFMIDNAMRNYENEINYSLDKKM